MADKMMRMAGRDTLGNAKPISIGENGEVITTQVKRLTKIIEQIELAPNQEHTTSRLSPNRYTKATLNLRMGNTSKTAVYVRYSGVEGVPTGPLILLYESDGTSNVHQISFPLVETLYELTIKNIATAGNNSISPVTTLTLSYDDDLLGEIRKTNSDLSANIKISNDNILLNLKDEFNKKEPVSTIDFNKTAAQWRDFTIGYDKKYYLIGLNYTIKVYSDFVNGEEVDSGIELTGDLLNLRKFIVNDVGVTYFVNTSNNEVAIYHAKDIHTQPIEVYRSNAQANYVFARNFGMDSFSDGLNNLILVGVYGTGQGKKPLLLSTDGGKSFKLVKETQNRDTTGNFNSHWHDVAIDKYQGYLWASEGDGALNQAIWYSDDLGESWEKIVSDKQPTSIDVFPNIVSLGRDTHLVGIDKIKKHNFVGDKMVVEPTKEFKNQNAYSYYANKAVVDGVEGYLNFSLYEGSNRPIILGTGDGGLSWHGLTFGLNDVDHFFGIDAKFVYARGFDGYIYYFERIKWG